MAFCVQALKNELARLLGMYSKELLELLPSSANANLHCLFQARRRVSTALFAHLMSNRPIPSSRMERAERTDQS
jgi:hypothetical protein